jgi:hypothetical protein
MNERMLKLYKQAQVPHTAIDPSNNMLYETTIFSAEKFAELIVKECAVVAHNTAEGETTYGWMVGNKIKEHFGVKE